MPVAAHGKYELLQPLTAGGMSELFLARQVLPDGRKRKVVVKRLLPQLAEDEEMVTLFLNEARITSRLNHPNIIRVFDLGTSGGDYFMALEFVEGQHLEMIQIRARQQGIYLPYDLISYLMASICRGLHHAHTLKDKSGKPMEVMHQDINPKNVMVTFSGEVKLVDFGLASSNKQGSTNKGGKLRGTFAYMAPEQCRGEPMDQRADIFSLGILLYEMCCRRRLFRRNTEFATIRAILKDPIPPPSAVSDEVPDSLEDIIMCALARNPEDRYATAQEMEQHLASSALENQWQAGPKEAAIFMEKVFTDGLSPQWTPGGSHIISASPQDDTLVDKSKVLDQVRTPSIPASATLPLRDTGDEERSTEDDEDFWTNSAVDVPEPLPALSDSMSEEALETEDMVTDLDLPPAPDSRPKVTRGLDDLDGEVDASDPEEAPTEIGAPAFDGMEPLDTGEDEFSALSNEMLVFEMGDGDTEKEVHEQQAEWNSENVVEVGSSVRAITESQTIPVGTTQEKNGRHAHVGRFTERVEPINEPLNHPIPRRGFPWVLTIAVLLLLLTMASVAALYFSGHFGLKSRVGRASVISNPPGATIFLDRQEQFGKTPLDLFELSLAQQHTLVVVLPGYHAWKKTFTIDPEKKKIDFKIKLQPEGQDVGIARLVISATPEEVQVYLDGELQGTTPLVLKKVSCEDPHKLIFRKEDYEDYTMKVEALKPDERRNLKVSLRPIPAPQNPKP